MRLKKLGKLLTSKFLLVCFLLLIEIAIIPAVFYWFFFSVDTTWIFAVLCAAVVILDLAIALWIVNSDMNAEYKIAWLMPVLFLPPIGALLYLNLRRRPRPRRRLKQLAEKFAGMECLYVKKDGHVGTEYADDGFAASCAEYVAQATGCRPRTAMNLSISRRERATASACSKSWKRRRNISSSNILSSAPENSGIPSSTS